MEADGCGQGEGRGFPVAACVTTNLKKALTPDTVIQLLNKEVVYNLSFHS